MATERMYPEMIFNTDRKTIHWEFIKSMEPPRITHMRVVEVLSKNNDFAQITVRFHSQQVLTKERIVRYSASFVVLLVKPDGNEFN